MATGRSPIKVPCENEDLFAKENAPNFDEDTLRGKSGSNLASAINRTFFYSTSFENGSRCGEGYKHCMTTSKDIWPVMALFHDNNMLFIERICEFVIFFSKSSKETCTQSYNK